MLVFLILVDGLIGIIAALAARFWGFRLLMLTLGQSGLLIFFYAVYTECYPLLTVVFFKFLLLVLVFFATEYEGAPSQQSPSRVVAS